MRLVRPAAGGDHNGPAPAGGGGTTRGARWPMFVHAALVLIGGIGLLLLGLRLMTDGLRLAAGHALEGILANWTRTPLRHRHRHRRPDHRRGAVLERSHGRHPGPGADRRRRSGTTGSDPDTVTPELSAGTPGAGRRRPAASAGLKQPPACRAQLRSARIVSRSRLSPKAGRKTCRASGASRASRAAIDSGSPCTRATGGRSRNPWYQANRPL